MDRQRLRDLWLPVLVGLAGILLSLAGWGLLVAERRAHLLALTAETAAEVREAIEDDLELQIETLRGLAAQWGEFGLPPSAEWTARVDQDVDRIAGLTAVAWVSLDPQRIRIAAGRGRPAGDLGIDAAALRRYAERPGGTPPERDASGAFVYRVFLPAPAKNAGAGVLAARFEVEPFLRSVLHARAHGYALAVRSGDTEIFANGVPTGDPRQRWWRVEDAIALPFGGSWRVVYRPMAPFAASLLTPLPHYLLAGGILLAAVLAALVHQIRVVVRQSRFLTASNRALEQRGLELESKVAERTEELREAIAELEAFNYSVSHDLRSPLGAILNFTAILEEDYRDRPLGDEGIALLDRIRRSASRATALLEDLLELSRAGRTSLTLEWVDMTGLARETFAQVRAAEQEDGGEVELLLEPLPGVSGDRALLGTVFANLFSNALKYSRGREKRCIRVTGRADADGRTYEVADNGQGFDMRFADKLFGLFERLHATEEVEGTGVGLAMVARIVKRHGGRVRADGRPGEGASFSFTIPQRGLS